MTPDKSTQGRNARKRGARAEVQVVNWLRGQGWPDTRRYLAGDGRQPGDIDWHPVIVLEVKDVAGSCWPTWCRQAVAAAGEGQVPCVVRRTRGVPDVAGWEVRLPVASLHDLGVVLVADRVVAVDGVPWAVTTMDALASMVMGMDW